MTNRWTWHGGGLAAARARFGQNGDRWIDLSTGINPHDWPGANAVSVDWRRLPEEGDLRMLEEAAARHFGCDADHVCAVPGTETGLRLIGALLGGPASHIAPTYRTHGDMVAGSHPLPMERIGEADGATLILANPNNPDGRLLNRDVLIDLLAQREREGWLILDEAFVDCHPDHSLASAIRDDARLILFRSFGKFFGLAGLRLGFVLGPRPILARLRQRLGAWPVSAAAITIGNAAYRDTSWIAAMRQRLTQEAEELDALLRACGHVPQGRCPLFRLIACANAAALFDRLARRAILTRPFDQDPTWLRIGLPGHADALDRLGKALRHG